MNKVRPQLLCDQIYESLRHDIIVGALKPRERITELAVARQMGTSQGPVREAFKRLEEEGLLYSVPHSGTFVSPLDLNEMHITYILRAQVEALAAADAVANLTAEDEQHLQGLIEEIVAAAASDNLGLLSARDLAFHAYVCKLSRHQLLIRVFRQLETNILRIAYRTRDLTGAYPPDVARSEHVELLEALKSGDPERAARAFRDHIAWDKLQKRMQEHVRS